MNDMTISERFPPEGYDPSDLDEEAPLDAPELDVDREAPLDEPQALPDADTIDVEQETEAFAPEGELIDIEEVAGIEERGTEEAFVNEGGYGETEERRQGASGDIGVS